MIYPLASSKLLIQLIKSMMFCFSYVYPGPTHTVHGIWPWGGSTWYFLCNNGGLLVTLSPKLTWSLWSNCNPAVIFWHSSTQVLFHVLLVLPVFITHTLYMCRDCVWTTTHYWSQACTALCTSWPKSHLMKLWDVLGAIPHLYWFNVCM